ncbi:hypothetical protein B0H15DRAFT_799618 [Mycena belliarum]|uniref:Uncharacterized protein n=1 Tax=Mycena belliarum TaxID=1033014 RepID=A0AAD6UB84_9AGAR|nr:hypothetical protein B0H15DRAFT_799618 [Mycena belliae]
MSSASRKRKAPSEVSLMDEDIWQHFRHCPDIQRIISYFHDPTVKKANLGVAEQAYAHFLEAVRAYRAWAPKSRFPEIESFIYTAAMSLFAFFTRVQSSETRKHYEFRAMYTDLAKLALKHPPANIDPPTADFVFPELDTVEALPTLPLLDTAPHSSPPPVPQVKRPKLETGAQSSPAASASRQPAPKPVRRPVPVKAAPRISLSPRSLPSLPRIARPVPSTSKPVKAPARPSLPTLPVEPDPDSEDDKSQDQEQDADADAEAEVDDDEEEEAQFTPEEDPEEEPAKPAPSKSKGKGKAAPLEAPKAAASRPTRPLPAPSPAQRPTSIVEPLEVLPLVVSNTAVGNALGSQDRFTPAMFPCTQCHGTGEQCFEEGRGLSCLPCKTKGIKCSHCLTGVAHMLLQQRAETFASGGASALIARFSAIAQSRRQVDLFRALAAHAYDDFNQSLRHLAFVFFQTKAGVTSEELSQYFEDPNDLAVVQGVLKRLQVSRAALWDEFKPRLSTSARQGAHSSPGGSVPRQHAASLPRMTSDWIDSPDVQDFLTGPHAFTPSLPAHYEATHPSRPLPMPLTPASDPDLFEALQEAAPAPPRTPPMAKLEEPEAPAPATPPRAPPPFSFTREPRAPPTTPGSVTWAGRAPLPPPAYAGYPYFPGYPPPGVYGPPGSQGGYYVGPPPPGPSTLGPSPLSAPPVTAPSPSPRPPSSPRPPQELPRPSPSPKPPMGQLAPATFEETAGTGEASGA